MRNLIPILLTLSVPQHVTAQTPETLARNVERLSVTLTLDREVYLPEEIPAATISISNPTPVPLIIPAPFRVETGRLVFAENVEGLGWLTEQHAEDIRYDATTPTISVAPGERKDLTFHFDQPAFNGSFALPSPHSAPSTANRYRFNYMYTASGEAAAFFRVVEGNSVDHLVDLQVPGPKSPWYRQVFVVRAGSEYVICVNRNGSNREAKPLRYVGRRYSGQFRLMRRIATSPLPIVNLQAELDPLHRIAVRWTDSANAVGLIVLDLDLNVVR